MMFWARGFLQVCAIAHAVLNAAFRCLEHSARTTYLCKQTNMLLQVPRDFLKHAQWCKQVKNDALKCLGHVGKHDAFRCLGSS